MLLFGISMITLGSIAPSLIAKFSLDEVTAGILFSILPLGILFGSLIFGPLVDKYGYKAFLIISCLFMFLGFQGIAQTTSLILLKICIFLFGLGGGAINGATNAVVSDISIKYKRANLSILGVFFAIGALGMPFILGILEDEYSYEVIVSAISFITLFSAAFFFLITFPPPKQVEGISIKQGVKLIKNDLLIFISFFLFLQSSFEGIINNWTTIYLLDQISLSHRYALYALSLYVVGMAVMRLLIGSVLRDVKSQNILIMSFVLLILGSTILKWGNSFPLAVMGLISIGAGLAAGYPLMLGFVGDLYKDFSGTAFSIVLTIGLLGNMLVNYLMGYIAENYGIMHLTSVAFIEILLMVVLSFIILKKINNKSIKNK